jgi:hypothetical protein
MDDTVVKSGAWCAHAWQDATLRGAGGKPGLAN